MGNRLVQKSMTLSDLERSITGKGGNQIVICQRCNVWLMLLLLSTGLVVVITDEPSNYEVHQ